MSAPSRRVSVDLGARSYEIAIGEGLLDEPSLLQPWLRGREVCLVSNETLAPRYFPRIEALLPPGSRVTHFTMGDGERFKSFETLTALLDTLLAERHSRATTLIAIGGGVVGDLTGFAAAIYQRGVAFIQVPTTLLAQVDSSIGGKTAVNHPRGKNMIGAFHQPEGVLVDTACLKTLPERELQAGLAEVIKYGAMHDADFFTWLEVHMGALLARDGDALGEAIARSCQAKAEVVAADEREGGARALLNLGHTFGHAMETHTGYGPWLHGEAVGAGMVLAADLSARLDLLPWADAVRIKSLVASAGLPVTGPEGMTQEAYLDLMALDKKVIDGRLRLVLLSALGAGVVRDDVPLTALRKTLERGPALCQSPT